MATCKDCAHVEVCGKLIMWQKFPELCNVENLATCCDSFTDRSKFVELPCHVGDTVYMLTEQTQKLGRRKVTNKVIVECCVDNFRIGDAGYPSAALCDSENVWCYGVEPEMFGEIIFLNREAAEQALKEREENA